MFSRFLSRATVGMYPVMLMEGEGVGGAGNTGGSENNDPLDPSGQQSGNPNPNPSDKKPDFKALAQAVVAEVLAAQSVKGDQNKALEVLAGRNARLEVALQQKTEEVGALRTSIPDAAQLQAERDELAKWRKLAEAGVAKPDDVTALVTERDALRQKDAEYEQDKVLTSASEVLGLKNNALYRNLFSNVPLVVEGEGENKSVKVKLREEKNGKVEETMVSFDDYSKKRPELLDALPALQADAPAGQTGGRHVKQGSGGKSATGSKYDSIRDNNKKQAEESGKDAAPALENIMHIGTNTPL